MPRPAPRQSPARPEPTDPGLLTPLGTVVWLLAASVVGVVGSILLEGARVAAPLGLAPALVILLPVELVCYLLALGAGVPRLPRVRTTLGVILGLALRGALALILALLAPSPLGNGGVRDQFLLYYARLWPAALVQVLAVTAFLWLIRDLLAVARREQPAAPLPGVAGDEADRQKQLLEALLEPGEPEPASPLPFSPSPTEAEPPRPSRLRRPRRPPAPPPQPALLPAEPPPPPAPAEQETALAWPTEPAADDTAALPLVPGPPDPADDPRPTLPDTEE